MKKQVMIRIGLIDLELCDDMLCYFGIENWREISETAHF